MSMQSRKLFESFSDVREDFIEEAQERQEKRNNTGRWLRWAAAAACACLLAGTAFLLRDQLGLSAAQNAETEAGGSDGRRWPVKIIEIDGNGQEEQLAAFVIPWEDREIYNQYAAVLFDGRLYLANGPATIDPEKLDEEPAEITAFSYEGGLTPEDIDYTPEHQISAKVSLMQGVSPECAVAVQYEGTEEWYPALNHSYAPQTLGQFVDDLNLRENLTFGTITYTYWSDGEYAQVNFDSVDSGKIWEMLLSNAEAENVCWELGAGAFFTLFDPEEGEPREILGISVSIPILGEENLALQVREDGYLWTNLMGMTEKAFLIGEENTRAFVDYVLNECEGYAIQYVFPEQPHEERKENDDSSTVSYIATPEGLIPADQFGSGSESQAAVPSIPETE